jgi:hypothetical protein
MDEAVVRREGLTQLRRSYSPVVAGFSHHLVILDDLAYMSKDGEQGPSQDQVAV